MARKSITDRLREIGKTDPNRLEESRELADKIVSFPTDQEKSENRDGVGTPLGQGSDPTRTPQGPHCNPTVTPPEQGRDRVGTESPFDQKISLPKQQENIYNWFLHRGFKGTFSKPLIHRETGIAHTTVRKTIRKFLNVGILRVLYDESLKVFEYEINSKIEVKRDGVGIGQGRGRDRVGTPRYIEEEDIYNLLLIEKFNLIYPSLHGIGFERSQIHNVIQSWKLNTIDLKDLPESLQRADFAVEHKSFKMDNPLNYVYSALMKGTFRKPNGYKSRAEIQAEERLAEQKLISEKNEETFHLWRDNLSPDKRAELCKGIPRIKQSTHLREIFDTDKDQVRN
jgi:hypothetical protein